MIAYSAFKAIKKHSDDKKAKHTGGQNTDQQLPPPVYQAAYERQGAQGGQTQPGNQYNNQYAGQYGNQYR